MVEVNQELAEAIAIMSQPTETTPATENTEVKGEEVVPPTNISTEVPAQPAEAKPEAKEIPESTRWQNLARLEKQIQQERQEAKAEREALKKELDEIKAFRAAKEQARTNPDKLLSETGLDIEWVNEYYLNQKNLTPEMKHKVELQELAKKIEAQEKRFQDREELEKSRMAEEVKTHEQNYLNQLNEFINVNKNEYEFIHLNEAHEEVDKVIRGYWQQTNKVLSYKEAADLVEQEYEKRFRELLPTSSKLRKLMDIKQDPKQVTPSNQNKMTTLNNDVKVQVGSAPSTNLSEEERFAEAIRIMQSKKT